MSCITGQDPQLLRLTEVIAAKVGQQRFHVWFNNSTRMDLKPDVLEICVPNDFISEWIGSHFSKPIQEAAHEVLGGPLRVRFNVMPQLFRQGQPEGVVLTMPAHAQPDALIAREPSDGPTHRREISHRPIAVPPVMSSTSGYSTRSRLRHDFKSFVVGASNQLAYNAALHVAQFPGSQYTPLFIHGDCGLGKTHLLQGICREFIQKHPTKRWAYVTGEDFTNEFVTAMRTNKLDVFRRRMRELDLLVIDDVHFLSGKKATQEEFLHTFNAIEAMGRQVVMASDSHPKMIEAFGESLINRFVSGMVVRIDPPNLQMRIDILKQVALRHQLVLSEAVAGWIARRVTQSVRELEGAVTRVAAYSRLNGGVVDEAIAQQALGELDRQHSQPIRTENIIHTVCDYFGVESRDLLSSRRDHAISMPRAVAMYLIRKMAKLSYPEIGHLLNKKNHSTVIGACQRVEAAILNHQPIVFATSAGERSEDAGELLARLEEQCHSGK